MGDVEPDLTQLLAAVSAGDESAFELLYQRTSAKLYGVILRIVRGRELADEILQDTFLRIWQRAGSYQPSTGRPMTWLIAVARYAAIDVARKRGPNLTSADDPAPPLEADPEHQFVVQDQLGQCLARLNKPQLECVLLAYCNGYSREELARHFGAQVATVKTWLHRAIAVLRQCMDTP